MVQPDLPDYYEVLGLGAACSAADIRAAYKALARRTHPDAGGTPALFRLINEAHEVLTDPKRREAYDRERASSDRSSMGGGGVEAVATERAERAERRAAALERELRASVVATPPPAEAVVGPRFEKTIRRRVLRAELLSAAVVLLVVCFWHLMRLSGLSAWAGGGQSSSLLAAALDAALGRSFNPLVVAVLAGSIMYGLRMTGAHFKLLLVEDRRARFAAVGLAAGLGSVVEYLPSPGAVAVGLVVPLLSAVAAQMLGERYLPNWRRSP